MQARPQRAFTLIELLVVVAIVAVLAGLVFSTVVSTKAKAKQTKCLSNLRQAGTAITLYMNEWDDRYPFAVDASDKHAPDIWGGNPEWQAKISDMPLLHELLQDYARSREVFECPADSGTWVLDNNFPTELRSSPTLYRQHGSSYFFRTEIAFSGLSGTSFAHPAEVNVLFDAAGHWHGRGRGLQPDDDLARVDSLLRGYRYNTLFGDLHAKSVGFNRMAEAWGVPL